jgi:hypothetical protein
MTIRSIALASAVVLGGLAASSGAFAGTEIRDSWAPGFVASDAGHYERMGTVNPLKGSAEVEFSATYQPGFVADEAGDYQKLVTVDELKDFAPAAGGAGSVHIEMRDSWAPGYVADEAGHYEKVTY